MKRLVILMFLAFGAACADPERTPVMGHWTGGFYTDQAEVLRGYLQLYRTGDKFKMRLASPNQELNLAGTWTIAKGRVELRVQDIEFHNPTEQQRVARNLVVFDSDRIRENYRKPIALDLRDDGRSLRGLAMTLDTIQGRHQFSKGPATERTEKALDRMGTSR